jgi:thiol-disulfide isomerase/thioredoxin
MTEFDQEGRRIEPTPPAGKPFSSGFLLLVMVLVGVGVGLLLTPRPPDRAGPERGRLVGQPMPTLVAQGWLNGAAPTAEELRGQVILIDAWAFWCMPCLRVAPELVKLHEAYAPRGVVFIGLTGEGSDRLADSQAFLARAKISWRQGYGAYDVLDRLRADTIPQVWIIDRRGQIVWDTWSEESMEAALDRALAESVPPTETPPATATVTAPSLK